MERDQSARRAGFLLRARRPGAFWSMCMAVVRDEAGAVLADEHVGHRFPLEHSLIQAMEICPLPSSTPKA
jgi:hypothetical protein